MTEPQHYKQPEKDRSVEKTYLSKSEKRIVIALYLPNLILSMFIYLTMAGLFQIILLYGKHLREIFILLILCIISPYIISIVLWFYKRKSSLFIDKVGRSVFNFTLFLLFWWGIVLLSIPTFLRLICGEPTDGLILLVVFEMMITSPVVAVLITIVSITGIVKTTQGKFFHVPLSFKYFKYRK
ncbi:DUF4870 domain-containing protein [Staphylococcus pettenkoferi]|mgnify:CR=1 FL=1|uniref:DUF4870 domain-containing protein n=1 Tax=Staphylococcus pettenkoferi TaxID=170573 RepID=UPI000F542F56|nr:DUF4870 domain-containing protein [Staphylococcus pettenkoferi]MCY1564164.1 DUF4870 domain-containing protein [Staphylococcus pettenkoferi]MCY1590246.1 DUF4870 domain-containing protein [Staphylococcus pettenkoferi]MCY1596140.1 DUF4870 domain-containing protein [Staphylococcus pettenkoferi]MCY1600351.1 DUF4870 domain-containing protein [Staphylococcus pettenkoferi]MCY1606712.1 DUF4870 domain-containing protein [Staphylococcus pettenkoferi]